MLQQFVNAQATFSEDTPDTLFQDYRVESAFYSAAPVHRQSLLAEDASEHICVGLDTFINAHFESTEHDCDDTVNVKFDLVVLEDG
jgi:hypothetical protein